MKYIKLFENYSIPENEFPKFGDGLSTKEDTKIKEKIPEKDFMKKVDILKDDGLYYIRYEYFDFDVHEEYIYYNVFDNFNLVLDYLLFRFYISTDNISNIRKLVKKTNLDLSFDFYFLFIWSCSKNLKLVKEILEKIPDIPAGEISVAIQTALDFEDESTDKIVKALLKDPRIYKKLEPSKLEDFKDDLDM